MKIGVIGDTHVPDLVPQIPPRVLELLNGVDIILHVGDITQLSVLQQLEPIAQTFAVYGDQDPAQVTKYLQDKQRLEFANRSVALIHGHQADQVSLIRKIWRGFSRKRREEALRHYALHEFPNTDVVVYGHSHEPYVKMHGGTMLFNPGAVVPRSGETGSIGMLEIVQNSITGKIIPL